MPALSQLLMSGPSQRDRRQMESHIRERYREYVRYVSGDSTLPLAMTQDEYVGEYAANHVARVRKRAAIALGAIRTPNAISALCAVLRGDMRRDVRATVLQALGSTDVC